MSADMLTPAEIALIDRGHCPNCQHRGFVLGPRGGSAINIECGNLKCRARFNVASASFTHHLMWGHRIAKEEDGGSNWDGPLSLQEGRSA